MCIYIYGLVKYLWGVAHVLRVWAAEPSRGHPSAASADPARFATSPWGPQHGWGATLQAMGVKPKKWMNMGTQIIYLSNLI
jgi:hypothetical protein